ncbi:MAG: hypothetical protein GC190_03100 [Alphaproteobacteria bacterium]|nr:hypothetical protein [Alphaproteobacteria bacterium]
MLDEQTILECERLRDDVGALQRDIRRRYSSATRQVTAPDIRETASHIAETWLVEIASDADVISVIGHKVAADLSVHFQRILTYSEHATIRAKYDSEIKAILKSYSVEVVVPLKQSRGKKIQALPTPAPTEVRILSAFVGQSFAAADERVNKCVMAALESIGIRTVTGEVPEAGSISEKVKRLIEGQPLFVGIFTRRDKIVGRSEWTTSAWVIDEKAYAVGSHKRLVLLKENGVGSIGGIQGDYEFLEFSRDRLEQLPAKIYGLFNLSNAGFRGR